MQEKIKCDNCDRALLPRFNAAMWEDLLINKVRFVVYVNQGKTVLTCKCGEKIEVKLGEKLSTAPP